MLIVPNHQNGRHDVTCNLYVAEKTYCYANSPISIYENYIGNNYIEVQR